MLTVGQALQLSTDYLKDKEVESSRLSAELLLAEVLGTDRLNVYLRFEQPLEQPEVDRLRGLLARRGKHEPMAYILGRKEFMGLDFEVASGVLIPRPDTELLVEAVKHRASDTGSLHIFEIGPGSGCIIISLLHALPQARGTAVDLSEKSLEITEKNAARIGVAERLTLHQGSLFEPLKDSPAASFDWIVSNPPYILDSEWAGLQKDVKDYEPAMALRAGPEGLEVYRPLITEAPRWLKPGGGLALEVSPATSSAVAQLMKSSGFSGIEILKDLAEHDRVVIGTFPGK